MSPNAGVRHCLHVLLRIKASANHWLELTISPTVRVKTQETVSKKQKNVSLERKRKKTHQ
jgi:hypothetical protein